MAEQCYEGPKYSPAPIPVPAGGHVVESPCKDKADQGGSAKTGKSSPGAAAPEFGPAARLPAWESVKILVVSARFMLHFCYLNLKVS